MPSSAPVSFGGNIVTEISSRDGFFPLAQNENYSFFYLKNFQKRRFQIELNNIVLLPLSGGKGAKINGQKIDTRSLLKAVDADFILEVDGPMEALIGGNEGSFSPTFSKTPLDQIKRVQKPWGYELWYCGEKEEFAFKKLFLKSQTRASLQYHEKKRETQFLYDGVMNFHYYGGKFSHGSEIDGAQIKQTQLKAKLSVHIDPMTIHRMEGVSDITIFEVSTPELDDVIRLRDDSARSSGRIESEHR